MELKALFKLLPFLSLLTPTATATSQELIKNYCTFSIYLTFANGSGVSDGPFELPEGQAYISDIIGEGNVCTISLNSEIYSPSTAKMDLGSSTSGGVLYWSIYPIDGDPMSGQAWNVSSSGPPGTAPGACGNTTTYNGEVYSCPDDGVLLTLSLC